MSFLITRPDTDLAIAAKFDRRAGRGVGGAMMSITTRAVGTASFTAVCIEYLPDIGMSSELPISPFLGQLITMQSMIMMLLLNPSATSLSLG
eukprot:1621196-Rhodomonas_salina.1